MNKGLNDPSRAYANKPDRTDPSGLPPHARFAPAENLYDAIRLDVGTGGMEDFEPLSRHYEREPPFSEIDEDWFDDETYKPA
jgi:hypothetical protein